MLIMLLRVLLTLQAVLNEAELYSEWIPFCTSSSLVKKVCESMPAFFVCVYAFMCISLCMSLCVCVPVCSFLTLEALHVNTGCHLLQVIKF
jgi:hypothetical protein